VCNPSSSGRYGGFSIFSIPPHRGGRDDETARGHAEHLEPIWKRNSGANTQMLPCGTKAELSVTTINSSELIKQRRIRFGVER